MSINVNKYLDCISNSLNILPKENLLKLIKYSPNFIYNNANDSIELKTKPLKNTLIILGIKTKEEINSILKDHLLKSILQFEIKNEKAIIVTDSESSCIELEKELKLKGINNIQIVFENIKEKILNNKHIFNTVLTSENYKPRKFSDSNENYISTNKFDLSEHSLLGNPNVKTKDNSIYSNFNYNLKKNSIYKGKKSLNKFDEFDSFYPQVPLNKDYDLDASSFKTAKYKYSFKDICYLFLELKTKKAFSLPYNLDISKFNELLSENERENLEYFKKQKKVYRDRAFTEVYNYQKCKFQHIFIFKAYDHKKSGDYWNLRKNSKY